MLLSPKEKKRLYHQYGPCALVTGASSGIGKELAEKLASAGFDLIINARNENNLLAIKESIQLKYNVQVDVMPIDLSVEGNTDVLIQKIHHKNIGLVVLAAGYGTSGLLKESSLHTEINMLRLNCESVLILSHYYAQRFSEQRRGGILFLSSMVAFQGVPYAAHYAATKAYIQSLAEGMSEELKPFHVSVLAAAPGPVVSGFGSRANMTMGKALSPEEVGVPILNALGRHNTVFPGWLTKLLVYSLRTLPRWGKIKVMKQVMSGMANQTRNTEGLVN
ncbi:MAG: SDR family NAD(P)-dependent oxidoreductase [Chitinophagaceae bacterium]|nr:SDR family NAD(P)-dependent oxidoreductase [Chitinophagaceae bacterium]